MSMMRSLPVATVPRKRWQSIRKRYRPSVSIFPVMILSGQFMNVKRSFIRKRLRSAGLKKICMRRQISAGCWEWSQRFTPLSWIRNCRRYWKKRWKMDVTPLWAVIRLMCLQKGWAWIRWWSGLVWQHSPRLWMRPSAQWNGSGRNGS